MYNRVGNEGADALIEAARASTWVHRLRLEHNRRVWGDTETRRDAFAAELREREALATWLVESGLAEWLGDDGPPLLSPYAAVVRELGAQRVEGLLALASLSEAQLRSHAALAPLSSAHREALVAVLLSKARALAAKDEL